uniref:Chalcone/stilbene synthase N-terminal domain-containing protein n=1 Tax=Oryza barthii TaxID=65489 RepID=A0A0D3HRZ7_9ORYZ
MSHTEETIAGHRELLNRAAPSLDVRLSFAQDVMPELAMVTAARAIAEWDHPAADITHLVISTNAGAHTLGADKRLRAILLHARLLRLAKDIADNTRGARVLVACAKVFLIAPVALDEAHLDTLVAVSLFGRGASAVIVGTNSRAPVKNPVFHMVSNRMGVRARAVASPPPPPQPQPPADQTRSRGRAEPLSANSPTPARLRALLPPPERREPQSPPRPTPNSQARPASRRRAVPPPPPPTPSALPREAEKPKDYPRKNS